MKRILFVIGQLRVGGVSKALIELLRCIEGMYDISLLCFDQNGAFFSDVPDSVHIVPTSNLLALTERSAKEMQAAGKRYALLRSGLSLGTKMAGKKWPAKILTKMVGTIPGEYDVAISYTHPMPDHMFCNLGAEIVLDCVNAKKKMVFIHCDFGAYGGNCAYNRQLLGRFDKIATVSDSVGRQIVNCVPEQAHKVCTVRNCHDFDKIREMAGVDPVVYTSDITFVTVARLSEEKGLLRCVPIFARLHQEGHNVRWHIVGNGPVRESLKEAITEYGADKCIQLEGEQVNPYRFLKNADFLLVPSFHEAAPVVFDEAAALGIKVISTQTLSAEEMVSARNIGVVCDNTDNGLEDAVRRAVLRFEEFPGKTSATVSNEDAKAGFMKLCEDGQ